MYYFTILNSPNISSLSSIHLATVAYASDVKKYGHAKVLKPLIDDLKDLEDGVVIDGVEGKVYGTVVHLPGDNLAANETQGFVGSFSANYFCRFCKMHHDTTKRCCREDESLLRNVNDHLSDLQTVAGNPQSASDHGVKTPCAFDELKYFNPIESFTPDAMHDVFEGVAKKEISLLISYIVTAKFITLTELNNIINSFTYGYVSNIR